MVGKAPVYGRDLLLELAVGKGVQYDRELITPRIPSKMQVILALSKKGINKPYEELHKIQELKRRIKLTILQQKAKDLSITLDHIIDHPFKLAIHIFCKDQKALEDLNRYQKSEPKTNTIYYNSKIQLTLDQWLSKEQELRKLVQEKLSDKDSDSIATLDKIIHLGHAVRCEIGIDSKKRIVERKGAPQFPNRKGSYDAYPLKKMVATYDLVKNVIQVSSHPQKTPLLIEAFSTVFTESADNFIVRKPSAEQATESFSNADVQVELEEKGIKVIEILLSRVLLNGNPSSIHLKGEDLLKTIRQLQDAEIHIVGKGISTISEIAFEVDQGKTVTVNFDSSNWKRTGDFTPEDEVKIGSVLSSWGA